MYEWDGVQYKEVAPPRGERGLKPLVRALVQARKRRSPSWGAWIETGMCWSRPAGYTKVAPPRGERGLKQWAAMETAARPESLPLVGSVD